MAGRVVSLHPPSDDAVSIRVALRDGASTTAHVRYHEANATDARVVVLREPESLLAWCERANVAEAIVGGFFVRAPRCLPLGEVRRHGVQRPSVPFSEPWAAVRSCVHVDAGELRVAGRAELPERPRGDLLQAGPMLVRDGRPVVADGVDAEGFSAGQAQFDSDITAGRYPRAALGVGDGMLVAVACDGRTEQDAGVTLGELAELLVALGARAAINLDGGGSTSLVCGGRLVNRPREAHGIALPGGRPIVTALAFGSR
jgi:Phosphodiester glycosidase